MGRRKGKTVVSIPAGKEPLGSSINALTESYQGELGKALNWYNSNVDAKQKRKWLVEYLAKSKTDKKVLAKIASLPDSAIPFGSAPILMRLASNGATLSPEHRKKIVAFMDEVITIAKDAKDESKKDVVKGPSIQDRLKEKILEFLGEFEGALDDFIEGKDCALDDRAAVVTFLKMRQIPAPYAKALSEWCDLKIREFGGAMTSKDEQIKEGYSNFSKKGLVHLVKTLAEVKQGVNDYAAFKKVNKAPRKRKEKPAAVQVAKLKYKVIDDTFKVKSVDPAEIIGADQLWTFNTKSRTLAVYRASGPAGLRVKGTTIIGFEPENSQQKRLRKPEETLKKLAEAGKVALRKFMDGIKAVEYRPNGRVNKDMILMKVG